MTQTRQNKNKWDGEPDPLNDALHELRARWDADKLGKVWAEFRARADRGGGVRVPMPQELAGLWVEFTVLVRPVALRYAYAWSEHLQAGGATVDDAADSGVDEAWQAWVRDPGPNPAASVQRAAQRGAVACATRTVGMGRAKGERLRNEGRNPISERRTPAASEEGEDALACHASTTRDVDWDPEEHLERKERQQLDGAVLADMARQAGIGPDAYRELLLHPDKMDPQTRKRLIAAMRRAAKRDDRDVPLVKSGEAPVRGVQGSFFDDPETVEYLVVGVPPQEPEDEDAEEEGQAQGM
jgi:hypothetical protein